MDQTQMPAEIAGVILPGLGHATRATGETDRGRHDVPVRLRLGHPNGRRRMARTTRSYPPQVASFACPRRSGSAAFFFEEWTIVQHWHIVGRKRPRRLSDA